MEQRDDWHLTELLHNPTGRVDPFAAAVRATRMAMVITDPEKPDNPIVFVKHLARGTSGLDVSAMIQRRWPDAMVVFVTANPSRIPADLAGADGVIAKPFTLAGLTASLRFLTEGLCDPPPHSPRPECLTPSSRLERLWAH